MSGAVKEKMNCAKYISPACQSVKLAQNPFARVRLVHTTAAVCKHTGAADSTQVEFMRQESTTRLLDFDHQSLAARGYLRSQKSYDPPSDVGARVQHACEVACGSATPDLNDPATKFAVLNQCSKAFNYRILNSYIHAITSVDDLVALYSTPVDTRVPLDRMRDIDLPKNLSVIYNYTRFHPDTDTKFGGITAFPGSSTIVTGLKEKKKYKGFVDAPEWLRYNLERETDFYQNSKRTHEKEHDSLYEF